MRSARHGTVGLAVLAIVGLLLAGCGGSAAGGAPEPAQASGTRTFQADNGPIVIPVKPQRVVTIAGAIPYVLKVGVKPVATTVMSFDDGTLRQWYTAPELAAFDAAPKVGNGPNLDFEAIASARPDLIVINVPKVAWPRFNAERLTSIAPTVFIELDTTKWKEFSQRLADAVGAAGAFDEQRTAYEKKTAELKSKYTGKVGSMTFAVVNRWSTSDTGSFAREYAQSYCGTHATDAGLQIPGTAAVAGNPFEDVSMELLGQLARFDALIYPLNADGSVKGTFVPVAESNAWKALPEVAAGRAVGVVCSAAMIDYRAGLTYLDSLDKALGTLPATG